MDFWWNESTVLNVLYNVTMLLQLAQIKIAVCKRNIVR